MSLLGIWFVLATILCIAGFGALTIVAICDECKEKKQS